MKYKPKKPNYDILLMWRLNITEPIFHLKLLFQIEINNTVIQVHVFIVIYCFLALYFYVHLIAFLQSWASVHASSAVGETGLSSLCLTLAHSSETVLCFYCLLWKFSPAKGQNSWGARKQNCSSPMFQTGTSSDWGLNMASPSGNLGGVCFTLWLICNTCPLHTPRRWWKSQHCLSCERFRQGLHLGEGPPPLSYFTGLWHGSLWSSC